MEVFLRLVKAVGIALALFLAAALLGLLMIWMKGLFALLIVLGVTIRFAYVWLKYRDITMRRKDRI